MYIVFEIFKQIVKLQNSSQKQGPEYNALTLAFNFPLSLSLNC